MQNTRLVASNGLHAVLTHPCPNSPAQAPIYLPNLPQLYLIPTTFSDLPTPKPPQSRLSTNSIKHTRLIYNVCVQNKAQWSPRSIGWSEISKEVPFRNSLWCHIAVVPCGQGACNGKPKHANATATIARTHTHTPSCLLPHPPTHRPRANTTATIARSYLPT